MFIHIDKPFTQDRIARIIIVLAITLCIILIFRYLCDILIPFAVAIMLAYIFNPVVELVQILMKPRVPVVIIIILLIAVIITGNRLYNHTL